MILSVTFNISNVAFIFLLVSGFSFFAYNIWKIRGNIKLGKPLDRSGNWTKRVKTTLLVAFGRKMF